EVLKYLEQHLKDIVLLDAFKGSKGKVYVVITPLNFKLQSFLSALKYENAVLIGIMDQNRDLRFLMNELDKVGLKVPDVFKEIQYVNPRFEYRSLIEKTEREFLSLDRKARANVRLLFDMITYGIYEGNYEIGREWVKGDLNFGDFAKVEGEKILPNVEKLYAIFNEDWSKSRILGVMERLSDNYKPFCLLAKRLLDKVRYFLVMNDDLRETLEIAITWAVNLAKEKGEVWEPYEILMYYRIEFSGFDDNVKLGIMDGEYILEKFRGKMDLGTELKIINILGLLNLYAGNLNQAEYYFKDVVNRGEGVIRDMALANLGLLEGRKGNLKAEYEIHKGLIEKSTDRRVLFVALRNILALYGDSSKFGAKLDLEEVVEYFNKGIKIFREVKDRNGELGLRYNFAVILANTGNYHDAIRQINEMIKITKGININEYADTTGLLGYVYLRMGDYEKAIQSFEEALRSFDLRYKNFEERYYVAKAFYALALAKYGKIDEAKLIVEEIEMKIGQLKLRPEIEELIKNKIEEVKGYLQG
ncbi:MAG: tetratricopeptide repeat protein, partial [Candidatus Caldipriscus sp.]